MRIQTGGVNMESYHGVIYFVAGNYPKIVMDRIVELSGVNSPVVKWDKYYAIDNPIAANGCFEELEDYFIEMGIPFDRNSSSWYENQPETRIYRPDELDMTVIRDNEGYEYVKACDLQAILADADLNAESKLLSIQALVEEQIPAVTNIDDYQILWIDERTSTPFKPTENQEEIGKVTMIIIKGEESSHAEESPHIERIVDEILSS